MSVRFRCPNCAAALTSAPGGLVCASGHRFDRAAEGYVHLLPAGRHPGAAAGDSAEMLRARRAFLDAGHYRPVMAAVAAMVPAGAAAVLDAGCGEGSYLAAVSAPERFGIDIAKAGVRLAARRHRDITFAVASSYRLPFFDASFDAVLSVFAPRPFAEFARVLRPGGAAVVASPGADHLDAVRELLYDATPEQPSPGAPPDPPHQGDHEQAAERVRYELTVTGHDLRHLVQMTPHWWRASPAHRDEVLRTPALVTTVDIWVTRSCSPGST